MMRNLDMTALRSFVAVTEHGGVTRAAGVLNFTQSAVSMQLKRLEETLGLPLFDRTNRRIELTAAGEQLLGYARRIVELNDEAMSRLTCPTFEGEVVLGVPHDIVYPVLPRVLQRFNAEFPRMKVQLISGYTSMLKPAFAKGEIDVIMTTESAPDANAEVLDERPLCWIGAPGGNAWRQRPIRYASARTCIFRPSAIRALEGAGIDWENAVETASDRLAPAIPACSRTRSSSASGSVSVVEMPTRIAPRSRRWRVRARVSTPEMPTTPCSRSASSRARRERQLEGIRAGSRTT